jgi:GNAT superfamily N-acetyltransferase
VGEFRVVTNSEHPELEAQVQEFRGEWPEFIFHDPVSAAHVDRVQEYFPQYDVLLLDGDQVVAGGWGVPLAWDASVATLPDGYDGGLVRAVNGHENGVAPDTLSVMAAAVKSGSQGGGLAGRVLAALRERAHEHGLERVIAPVRPTLKTRYPLTPMDRFAGWLRDDGLHIDPWIRTHQRLGATILAPAPRSMIIRGSVAEWEEWTGMLFPETARYVVPQALDLVSIDREQDEGIYEETNLWMRHT